MFMRTIVFAGLAASLAACGGMEAEEFGSTATGLKGEPRECPAVWDPVCGVNGVTYGNGCEADLAGIAVAYQGECRNDRIPGPTPEPVPLPEPIACPDVWDPVCGVDGQTYGNACEARVAGVRIAHRGECRDGIPRPTPDPIPLPEVEPVDCICPHVYDPVCGTNGVTYGNGCFATCAGATIEHKGPCGGGITH